jgi:hypothetical protein
MMINEYVDQLRWESLNRYIESYFVWFEVLGLVLSMMWGGFFRLICLWRAHFFFFSLQSSSCQRRKDVTVAVVCDFEWNVRVEVRSDSDAMVFEQEGGGGGGLGKKHRCWMKGFFLKKKKLKLMYGLMKRHHNKSIHRVTRRIYVSPQLEGLEKMNFWNGFHQGQEELGRLEAVD